MELRIAYLVTAHQAPEQVARLVSAIRHPHNSVLIHLDRKAGRETRDRFHAVLRDADAELFSSRRIYWGGWSQVAVVFDALARLRSRRWDFLINLSGQDFPLVDQETLREFLGRRRDHNFADCRDQEKVWPGSLGRLTCYSVELGRRAYRVPFIPRARPTWFRPYVGSSWWILTREFCDALVTNPTFAELARCFRRTLCPDEGFFQTALMNSGFAATVVNDNKRLIEFIPPNINPRLWHEADLPRLTASSAFFARKFAPGDPVLRVLEERLRLSAPGRPAERAGAGLSL